MTDLKSKTFRAILALENGAVFHGAAIGAVDSLDYSCGELVFNTSMTGYQEIITDPSYCEQVILFTVPHIGNVGVNSEDFESNHTDKVWSKGIVIKSLSKSASNWRSEQSLNDYLVKNKLIGISDIDTRAVTNLLRDNGSLKSCIYVIKNNDSADILATKAIELAKGSRGLNNLDLAKEVASDKIYNWEQKTYKINQPRSKKDLLTDIQATKIKQEYHIIVYDFGVKAQILKLLADRNCKITVVPAQTSADEVLMLKPDGVLLSNGPGDPSACNYAVDNTKALIKNKIPLFGICLGFQILALALGAKTTKMKFGHHGGNHPVKDLNSERVLITSQNHGFMVDDKDLPDEIRITHKSLFDQSIQGIAHRTLPVFGFQGHPEASPGPNDIEYLFDQFINNVVQFCKANDVNSVNKEMV